MSKREAGNKIGHEIGIMQGRLAPRWIGRYQAFPVGYWQSEFHIARELALDNIEFILDYGTEHLNPLMSESGVEEIKSTIVASGVGVKAICADYFMEAPFHSHHQKRSESVLDLLLRNASSIGVKDIVIPCVDQSSLKTEEQMKMVTESISKALPLAERLMINLNFETDLGPKEFAAFLKRFQSPRIKVNYDIGNSASLDYNPTEEFEAYGALISDLHIKDRPKGAGSVKLGTGNAKFDLVFGLLKQIGFAGNITMQASRATDYASEFAHVTEQLKFTKDYVARFLA
jgi:L-ribulose-5-phosphate 3-epimerase